MEPTKKEFLKRYDAYFEEGLMRLEKVSDFLDNIDIASMMVYWEDIQDLLERIEQAYPFPDEFSYTDEAGEIYQVYCDIESDEFETYLNCRYGKGVTREDCIVRITY